jgi:transcriptional regulator with PAS, ATPase and Fis domain
LRGGKIFRDDFFYRISSDIITTPSLRERLREDERELELLLETILQRMTGENWKELFPTVRERLLESPGPNYDWPGNVRELEQAVRRILVSGSYQPHVAKNDRADSFCGKIQRLELTADELLSGYCQRAVEVCGTRAEAARKLSLDVRTLQKYLPTKL